MRYNVGGKMSNSKGTYITYAVLAAVFGTVLLTVVGWQATRMLGQIDKNAQSIQANAESIRDLKYDIGEVGRDVKRINVGIELTSIDVERRFSVALIVSEPTRGEGRIHRLANVYDPQKRNVDKFMKGQMFLNDSLNDSKSMAKFVKDIRATSPDIISFREIEAVAVPDRVEKLRIKKIDKRYSFIGAIPIDTTYGVGKGVTSSEIKEVLKNNGWFYDSSYIVSGASTYKSLLAELTANPTIFVPAK